MRLSSVAVDPKREEEGVWQPVGEDAEVLIARIGNPRYRNVMKRLLAPHRQAMRAGVLPEEKASDVMADAMAETIILDWRGLEDENGNTLSYSKEECRRILKDPRYREFRELLYKFAEDADLFRVQSISEDAAHLKA